MTVQTTSPSGGKDENQSGEIITSSDPAPTLRKSKKKKPKSPAEQERIKVIHLSQLPTAPPPALTGLTSSTPTPTLTPLFSPFSPSPSPFLTPSTLTHPHLTTPRLTLRPVQPTDLAAITRIKTDPLVQRTQLYGSPSARECRDAFLARYLMARVPRLDVGGVGGMGSGWRSEYIFGIEVRGDMKDGEGEGKGKGVRLRDAKEVGVGMRGRIEDTRGYVGNIALSTHLEAPGANLFPRPRRVFTLPTFDQTSSAELVGSLFYELHPQLWGQGLMREAFSEVLRFAFEEVGCMAVEADPMVGNTSSIALCTSHGMKYTHTTRDNPYRKPQAFHRITRKEWFARYKPGQEVKGKWEGKVGCRWCLMSLEPANGIGIGGGVGEAISSGGDGKRMDGKYDNSGDQEESERLHIDEPGSRPVDHTQSSTNSVGRDQPTELDTSPQAANTVNDSSTLDSSSPLLIYRCRGCDWAAYCSEECRYAEWVLAGNSGHQASCTG